MNEDKIKEAFQKAKQDILSLHSEFELIKKEIHQLKQLIIRQTNRQTDTSTQNKTETAQNPTIRHINPTYDTSSTDNTTHNYPLEAVKTTNSIISIGNEGVSTDRQTDRQTDTSTGNEGVKVRLSHEIKPNGKKIEKLEKVTDFLDSLDDIKKELRNKVKSLTNQEMTVLTSIYQLEEQGFTVDYSLIAEKLSLTQSSIRDYVQRIINKGIPIEKIKENNKKVILSISRNLKKIATLSTIIQLRSM